MSEIPAGMIRLTALPVGEDGAPVWNDEVDAATQRFGSEFLAPFMVEVSPGMVIGGYAARATFCTSVRTYEAKATLIVRKNDELRTTVVVTAPDARDKENQLPWRAYSHEYRASLPKIHLENMVHTIRGLCEQSHAKELLMRDQSPVEAKQEAPTYSDHFKVNEFVVYPAHGVGQVLAVERQQIAGANLDFLVINFNKDKMTLRVPVAKVANVGMRKLSEPKAVEFALSLLSEGVKNRYLVWADEAQDFEAKINSGDIVAIVEAVRDLYPPHSYSERQLYDAALSRLSQEAAIVLRMSEADSIALIEARLCNLSGATDKPSERLMAQEEATEARDRSVNSTIGEKPMSDPIKDLQNSIARNAALLSEPTDHALMRQAENSRGHISLKAVSDEYNRLILQKIESRRPRGLWARLFGG
jgi:CarD family transcriptional regulator